ncbi:hypothetical protein [Sporosalibacterium faouarense]|uniref:hypothetical protein n=1 Tax=Sporosalibacterium faouarense TaxID=516123 RepID=UPI00192ACEF0|nr:hypothetical protein [Sporosalibacterium faouarense]
MDRHFTVSVFIVHKNKVLLHLHKKAKKMLPLGGHNEGESNLLKWYNKEELNNTDDIQDNILTMANEALDILSKN